MRGSLCSHIKFSIPRTTTHHGTYGSYVMYHLEVSLSMTPTEIFETGARLNQLGRPSEKFVVRRRFSDFKNLQALVARVSNLSEPA